MSIMGISEMMDRSMLIFKNDLGSLLFFIIIWNYYIYFK